MKVSMSILKNVYLIAVVLLIMAARGLPLWLLSLFIITALALPLIREIRQGTDLDERQVYISHLSSHIAFYVFLGLLLFTMVESFISEKLNPDGRWYMLLIIPLVIKFMISVFQNYGVIRAARWTGFFFGGIWLLFVIFSHGISGATVIEALPFLLIIAIACFVNRNTLISGLAFVLFGIILTIFFRGWIKLDIYIRLIMYALIPLPLFVSGVALIYKYLKKEVEP